MPDTISDPRPVSVAVIGDGLPAGPHHAGLYLSTSPGAFDGIVLTERIAPEALRARLGRIPVHCPVADLAGNAWFAGDGDPGAGGNPDKALLALRDLVSRIRALPDYAASPDRADLELLAYMHTRAASLTPAFTPLCEETVHYPAMRGRIEIGPVELRRRLEQLAELGLLRRSFFARVLSCPDCGSGRLSAYEACTQCGFSDLREEMLIHHFRCGHQAPESRFLIDGDLVCPKCRRDLRHFGVDYSKPGMTVSCAQCAHVMPEPRPRFACLDCSHAFDGDAADSTDWHRYELTGSGHEAVLDGRLPHADFAELARPYRRAFSLRDFQVAAGELARVSRRYGRPLILAQLHVENEAELRARLGPTGMGATYRMLVDMLAENLRESDFFAATHAHGFVVALPETDAKHVSTILDRLVARLNEAAAAHVDVRVDVREGDRAGKLIAELKP